MCDIENIDGIRDGIIGMKDDEISEEKKVGTGCTSWKTLG